MRLDGGGPDGGSAAWFIAVAGTTGFRDRLGGLLRAGDVRYAGQGPLRGRRRLRSTCRRGRPRVMCSSLKL
ncbi:DUF6000 family protein [Streptomyces spinosirectus]